MMPNNYFQSVSSPIFASLEHLEMYPHKMLEIFSSEIRHRQWTHQVVSHVQLQSDNNFIVHFSEFKLNHSKCGSCQSGK